MAVALPLDGLAPGRFPTPPQGIGTFLKHSLPHNVFLEGKRVAKPSRGENGSYGGTKRNSACEPRSRASKGGTEDESEPQTEGNSNADIASFRITPVIFTHLYQSPIIGSGKAVKVAAMGVPPPGARRFPDRRVLSCVEVGNSKSGD